MNRLLRQAGLVFLLAGVTMISYAQGNASRLFEQFKQQVFQIRVIDIASGDKNSIGSGFQISASGHLATNFHVVSSYVHEPEKFRLEYVYHDGSTGDIQLLDIDVIHDLAIVKIDPLQEKYFKFNLEPLSKGEHIYSMGNPHDLSMLIIEGNYNGLIKESRYRKILFSGSLNPGMSGGPAFDKQGKLIGVNVAKGGEQLSFLVPIDKLYSLYSRVKEKGATEDFKKNIATDLVSDQQMFYSSLLEASWVTETLGELTVPGKLHESLKCWGHTVDKEDIYYKGVHKHCQAQDRIYVSQDMQTGKFAYDFEWITNKKLNRFQFYSQLQRRFSQPGVNTSYKKEDITNYICNADFISLSQHSWKISTCTREYKDYPGLYDVTLLLASVDLNDRSLVVKTSMSGVSKENSIKFSKKFLEAIKWNN